MFFVTPLIQILLYAIDIYIWLVIISAIMSWLVAFNVINTGNSFIYQIGRALYQLTDPALRPIRRFLPNLGGIDISPVILILLLYFLQMLLVQINSALV